MTKALRTALAWTPALTLAFMTLIPDGLGAQQDAEIAFDTDLPRVLVFIQEEDGQIAAREMTNFLLEGGFPVVDPALAYTAAQRELVQAALGGDEGAATSLGRDFGAQVLILGRADWGTRPDMVDQTAITATGEVAVRALRLDLGRVIATAEGDGGRILEATEQRGKARVLRRATQEVLENTSFLGQLMNNWVDDPWENALYWVPDPGSVQAELAADDRGAGPGLAILLADVSPSTQTGATRGLGVVKKGDRSSALFNPIRIEGVVIGETRGVEVEGKPANLVDLEEGEAERLGIEGQTAQRFWAETFPMWDVKTALRRQISAERVIVVADACHSAGTADGDVVGGAEGNAIAGGFAQLFSPSRRLMMTAADTNEFSLEDARWGGHGVFTHFLLDGLKGNGDANADGIVTFSEIFDYVSNSVVSATEGRQNPQRSGFGDVPLAVVEVGGAGG